MSTELIDAYLGLGSNLGDRLENLQKVREILSQRLRVTKVSPVYETEPVGDPEQPLFLNQVCLVQTRLGAADLLRLVKGIEQKMGRVGKSGAPRVIDIDILLYGELVMDTPELTIPHPRMTERGFVLVPLSEIAPDLKHPVSKKTVAQLLKELKKGRQGVLPLDTV